MKTEIGRLARHILPPALTYAVGRGWIPPELQQPILEASLAIGGVLVALYSSKRWGGK